MISIRTPMLVGVVLSLSLAACSGTKKQLGLERDPPDEFAVVTRAPLSLPPDYKLRPPEPGAPRPQEAPVSAQAREAVFGRDGRVDPGPQQPANPQPGNQARVTLASNAPQVTAAPQGSVSRQTVGESALLRMSGADRADGQIRQLVDKESAILADAGVTFLDRLLDFRDPEQPGTVLDAQAEAKLLREKQALGRPVTEGPSPNIERKERGLLEGIF